MVGNNQDLGRTGEDIAAKYLTKHGYKIIARNFRCRSGEIDIIARDGEYIVFVEVKARTSDRYGAATEAVNIHKQQRLKRLATYYLHMTGQLNVNCRFDVVILMPDHNKDWAVSIIKNAF